MKGKLWWIADNAEQLLEWSDEYFNKGGLSILNLARMPKDGERIHIVFELEKLKAPKLIGYRPSAEEWLGA